MASGGRLLLDRILAEHHVTTANLDSDGLSLPRELGLGSGGGTVTSENTRKHQASGGSRHADGEGGAGRISGLQEAGSTLAKRSKI